MQPSKSLCNGESAIQLSPKRPAPARAPSGPLDTCASLGQARTQTQTQTPSRAALPSGTKLRPRGASRLARPGSRRLARPPQHSARREPPSKVGRRNPWRRLDFRPALASPRSRSAGCEAEGEEDAKEEEEEAKERQTGEFKFRRSNFVKGIM